MNKHKFTLLSLVYFDGLNVFPALETENEPEVCIYRAFD